MSAPLQRRLEALAHELAAAVGALTGAGAEAVAGGPSRARSWVATLTTGGEFRGDCVMTLDHAGASALKGLLAVDAEGGDDAAVAGVLRDVIARATAAMANRPAEERLDLELSSLRARDDDGRAADPAAALFVIRGEGLAAPISVALVWTRREEAADGLDVGTDAGAGSRLDVLLGIDLPVVVRFGHTRIPIRTLSRLGPGSVIELGRSPDDPVEVLVSNHVVAKGEVVIVGGNYGVRILDVTSKAERARSMED